MTVAESLKRFRQTFNLKQKDVANKLGVSPQAYQITESKGNPSAKALIVLSNEYNVSADYLLGLSDEPRPKKENQAEPNALTTAAENNNLQDFYENLAHKLAQQGINI